MALKLFLTAVVVAAAYLIYKVIVVSINQAFKRLKRPLTMPNTLRTIIGSIVAVIALMIVLDFWGVSVTGLAASLGIGGIIIGLALQEPLSNFTSGILLLLSGAIKEGDTVGISGISGTVESLTVNHTVLRTFDGKKVLIPNRTVWGEILTHYWPSSIRRVELKVGVSYDSDMEKVIEVLNRCLEEEELVEKDPAPYIVFDGFNSSSIDFILRFWVKRENYFGAQMNLAIRIKKAFAEEGIEIPFNQLDVHIKKD